MKGHPPAGLVVERVRVTVLSAPIADAVPMSFGRLDNRQACLLQVDAGGLTGIAESWINYPSWAPRERVATLLEGVAPVLIGQEASSPYDVLEQLKSELLPIGRQWGAVGPIWQALSAVDVALWDLRGKALGLSTASLLAGEDAARTTGSPPTAYASGVGPTDVADQCAHALARGLDMVKVKLGFGFDTDRSTLATARSVLGEERTLLADANQAWDLKTAVEMSAVAREYGVGWLEEPLAGNRLSDLERLAADCTIPLATGENLYGVGSFERYVASPAVDIIQPDLSKAGGLTVGRIVATVAERSGTVVAPHCYSSVLGIVAGLHLAASGVPVRWIEYDIRENPFRTDLLTRPLSFVGDVPQLPDGPGLGVDLDPDAIARFRVHVEERTQHGN